MRMKYVLKPLALSALAVGLLFVGTPAVQAGQNGDAPQGYKQKGDRDGRQDADRGGRHYDRKDSKNQPNGRMDGRHDNRSAQGEKMGKPRYDSDKGDRRSPRGDEMGRPRDDRRPPRDMQQRDSQKGQRPAARPADNDDDVRN